MIELRSTLTKAAEQVIQVSTMQNQFEGYMFFVNSTPLPQFGPLILNIKVFFPKHQYKV